MLALWKIMLRSVKAFGQLIEFSRWDHHTCLWRPMLTPASKHALTLPYFTIPYLTLPYLTLTSNSVNNLWMLSRLNSIHLMHGILKARLTSEVLCCDCYLSNCLLSRDLPFHNMCIYIYIYLSLSTDSCCYEEDPFPRVEEICGKNGSNKNKHSMFETELTSWLCMLSLSLSLPPSAHEWTCRISAG